jgi:hypothetical protein
MVANPDWSLEDHWNGGGARSAIRRGWEVVVLQRAAEAAIADQGVGASRQVANRRARSGRSRAETAKRPPDADASSGRSIQG